MPVSASAPKRSTEMPLLEGILFHLHYTLGKSVGEAGERDSRSGSGIK